MGEMAEATVTLAIESFLKGNDSADKVSSMSEILVTMSMDIEDKAFELTARYQPVASDLRIIKSYMKIAYDLERYGRYAWDISFAYKRIAGLERCTYYWTLMEKLTEKVIEIVRESIEALRNHNVELAKGLAEIEKEVDEIYFEYLEQTAKAPPTTKCLISNVLVVRSLERIADHAAYVGESIVYIVTGEKVTLR